MAIKKSNSLAAMLPHLENMALASSPLPYSALGASITGEAQISAMHHLMSGEAAFKALRQAVNKLKSSAPRDHDVLVTAFGLNVLTVNYIAPHTFLFDGFNNDGNTTFAACHFSQLVAHVIYVPKRGEERVVTGFSKQT